MKGGTTHGIHDVTQHGKAGIRLEDLACNNESDESDGDVHIYISIDGDCLLAQIGSDRWLAKKW